MEIIEKLKVHRFWEEFKVHKEEKGHLGKKDLEDLTRFIDRREYENVVQKISQPSGPEIGLPVMHEINKSGTGRKRIVFTFSREENYVFKMLAFLLHKYDDLFPDNLYSFRENTGVKNAIRNLRKTVDPGSVYSYKVDIQDYFNSVPPERILCLLRQHLEEEPLLIRLFESILMESQAVWKGQTVRVKKGIMAGVPVAGFLANLYLKGMDEWFFREGILYIRYSDDIIIFADNEKTIRRGEGKIRQILADQGLKINERKEFRTSPGQPIEFLGFVFDGQEINVAPMSVKKLKDKLRRKARAIYRWKLRKNVPDEKAALAYVRYLDRKFYGNPIYGEITWCRWYFPVITSDNALRLIDRYAIDCIRYIYTGRHGKKNYNLRYEQIRKLGYQSLVRSYWRYRRGDRYESG